MGELTTRLIGTLQSVGGGPRLRRRAWRTVYQFLARRYRMPEWTFMNYGWSDPTGAAPPEAYRREAEQIPDLSRSPARLYYQIASAADLEGKRLLEVGSGRGGGLAFVHRALGPAESVGIDIAPEAASLSGELHHEPGLRYMPGDAEAIPFPDASFDAVLNVESSHCYGSMPTFLAEVRRVLRPGGHLLLGDLRDPPELDDFYAAIRGCGLEVVEEQDITPGVVAALDHDDSFKTVRIEESVARPLRPFLRHFAATRDSGQYKAFAEGNKIYLRFVLRKPA